MNNLILHCGANAIDRASLAQVLPGPALGARHNPVPYIDTVDLVADSLGAFGFRIKEEAFGLMGDGSRFFGLMAVEPAVEGELLPRKADYDLMIGLRGSYDQTLPRGFACGSRVFVCDNLAFSGEVTVHTKQTTYINRRMPALIQRAVEQIADLAKLQVLRFDRYRNHRLSPQEGDATITNLLRRQVVGPHHMARLLKEWDEPVHPEHMAEGRTVWTLHNAVTEAIKPAGEGRPAVLSAQSRTIGLTRLLDRLVGLELEPTPMALAA